MNTLLAELARACGEYKFEPKQLVVNSYHSGHHLLEALARSGTAWLNLTPRTPLDLAREIAGPALDREGFELLDDSESFYLVHEVIAETKARGRLEYFADLEGLQGPAGILQGPLLELRWSGVNSSRVNPDSFVDPQKGREVRDLLQGYGDRLEAKKLADQTGVFEKAIAVLEQDDPAAGAGIIYLIPEQLEFDYLAYYFLELLTRSRRVVLAEEPVRALARPRANFFPAPRRPEPVSSFSNLFDPRPGPKPGDPDADLFQACSPAAEIKEVFRRLQQEETPLDQTLLCYTRGDDYLPLIYTEAGAHGIPVTCEEGVPALFFRPGQLLAGLLAWMEENYASSHLYRLLLAGCFNVQHQSSLARLLRQAALGWDRDRYPACLEAVREALEDRHRQAQARADQGRETYRTEQLERFSELAELVEYLLAQVPAPDRDHRVQLEDLCAGLHAVIQTYSTTATAEDRAAREAVLEMLQAAGRRYREQVDVRTGIRRLQALLRHLRSGAAPASPGHLHVAPLRRGEWVSRSRTFVLGLDEGRFPGARLQDPVLLDVERRRLSKRLRDSSANPERSLYQLNRFLAGRRGRVTLSFSAFDPVQGRPSFPSSVLLQVHRLQRGCPEDDYSDLFRSLGAPAAYYPGAAEQALADYEWWLALVLGDGRDGCSYSVRNCYPGIDAGLAAAASRREGRFTEYDGRVSADPARVDPRLDPNRVVSPSSLEKLASCPFAYFLQYVLGIRQPEDPSFDRWQWLDPATRGSLLHRIYAIYLRRAGDPAAGGLGELARLQSIAEDEIAAMREVVPPPGEVVFQRERNALLGDLPVFLRLEEELRQKGHSPLGLEVPFGLGPEEIAAAGGLGREDPVPLPLPGGGFIRLRGRIDRIDWLPETGVYQVWDYKTGSTYGRSRNRPLQKGRQLQPFLYALAAEAILAERDGGARVTHTGYLFPTAKGEGKILPLNRDLCSQALQAVDLMLGLASAGAFAPAEDANVCTFCDYGSVCRYPASVEQMQVMKEEPINQELEPWRELQTYE